MEEERCDVCDSTSNLSYCGHCYDAVYCGKSCQQKDFHEHQHECKHPDEMTDAEVMAEIKLHIMYPDDEDSHIGLSIGDLATIDANRGRDFLQRKRVNLAKKRAKGVKRRFNRKTRSARRDGRNARNTSGTQNAAEKSKRRYYNAASNRDRDQAKVLNF
jgi:hypothetical protein